jgi:sugar/nucleoside kinase (ribokinase family)
VAVAKLAGLANLAGQVGNNMFGAFLIEALQRYNVNT